MDISLRSLGGFVAALLPFVVASTPASGQGTLHLYQGDAIGALFGTAVADAGDVDLDGFPDFIVGSKLGHHDGVPVGSATVFSGQDDSLLHSFFGAQAADFFGYSVAGAGDVDGDGHPDLMVGAPQGDHLQYNNGSARVCSGQNGATLYTWGGLHPNTEFGHAVAGIGDVDGDGFPDVAVGTWRDHPNGLYSGGTFIYSGQTGQLVHYLTGDAEGDYLGYAVAGAGDANGDGRADVVVGMPYDDDGAPDGGGARLYSGLDGSVLHQWFGAAAGDTYGSAVAGVFDVNGDGCDDVLIGAPRADLAGVDSGAAEVRSGADGALLLATVGTAGTRYGAAVAGADDVDGDTVPDLIIGAPWYASQSGRVHVVSGALGVDLRVLIGPPLSSFGAAVSSARDANRDTVPDVLIGAPRDDTAGVDSGSAHVISVVCGSTTPIGSGCPGSGGFVPSLAIDGCPTPDGQIVLRIQGGLGGTLALLFLGTGDGVLPVGGGGCPILIAPLLPPVFPLPLAGSGPGNGFLEIPAGIPAMAQANLVLTLQTLLADPGGAAGYSTTAGLRMTLL